MNATQSPHKTISGNWHHLVAFCLDVIFPPTCAYCRRTGWLLCPQCETRMVTVPAAICLCCGRIHEANDNPWLGGICEQCRAHPSPLSRMRAPLRYLEPTSTVIHRFKYEGCFALARPLARFLIDGWPVWETAPDLILPIPLHPRRKRRRGYNQSELLARPVGEALGITVETALLHRTRHTVPQVGLGPDERHDNVQGAFAAEAVGVRGSHVLLVDDVLTTGATMRAAAEAVLAAGAASVAAYCLARVS